MRTTLIRPLGAAAVVLAVSLSACSGEDDPEPDPSVSVDGGPSDEEAVESLVDQLWDARVATQNPGEVTPEPFQGVLAPELIEGELGSVQAYADEGVTREGGPQITDVEATVDGDSGVVLACLNEDDWVFVIPEQPDFEQPKNGNVVWGAEVTRTDDEWLITAELADDDERKEAKSC